MNGESFYRYVQCVILSEAAVALCQSQMNLLLELCCMGVVYQIEDLDNSSKDLKTLTLRIDHACQV